MLSCSVPGRSESRFCPVTASSDVCVIRHERHSAIWYSRSRDVSQRRLLFDAGLDAYRPVLAGVVHADQAARLRACVVSLVRRRRLMNVPTLLYWLSWLRTGIRMRVPSLGNDGSSARGGERLVVQGRVGHRLEFIATDTVCGLHGDAGCTLRSREPVAGSGHRWA